MSSAHEVLAVIFDFDGTLVPDSTTKLLAQHQIDTDEFWGREAKALVDEGFDPTLAYLELILDRIGAGKPLGELTSARLRDFGAGLDGDFYPGLPTLFKDLKAIAAKFKVVDVEFYIVSSGLGDIIRGSKLVEKNFDGVYASELAAGPQTGLLGRIKRCVTFTEKTRYLFEINKGLEQSRTAKNPYLVNTNVPPGTRRVPFKNMIYVGDGLTDIPCFSLLQHNDGTAFGVFDPRQEKSARVAFQEFLKTDRVVSCHAPKYRKGDELGSLLRTAITMRCGQIEVERQEAVRRV